MEIKAAVSKSLPVSALLGTDAAELGQLLQSNPLTNGLDHALVTTRSQSKQKAEEELEREMCKTRCGVRSRQLTEDANTQRKEEGYVEAQGGSFQTTYSSHWWKGGS